MKPIGLTLKNIKHSSHTGKTSGEIMVVHLCLSCGGISCNRIAGDDNPYTVINMLEETEKQNSDIITRLARLRIKLLSHDDKQQTIISLFGINFT